MFLFHSQSYLYFLFIDQHPFLFTRFLMLFPRLGKVLLDNPCANLFVVRDFNFHYKYLLKYSGGVKLIDLMEFAIVFYFGLSSLTFLFGSLTVMLAVISMVLSFTSLP